MTVFWHVTHFTSSSFLPLVCKHHSNIFILLSDLAVPANGGAALHSDRAITSFQDLSVTENSPGNSFFFGNQNIALGLALVNVFSVDVPQLNYDSLQFTLCMWVWNCCELLCHVLCTWLIHANPWLTVDALVVLISFVISPSSAFCK